jgi:hypothetical protein
MTIMTLGNLDRNGYVTPDAAAGDPRWTLV